MTQQKQQAAILFGSLPNVCNGGEIHSVGGLGTTSPLDSADDEDFMRVMGYETKAIMVVEHISQKYLEARLTSWTPAGGDKSPLFRARRLCKWSGEASLWIIRKKTEAITMEENPGG